MYIKRAIEDKIIKYSQEYPVIMLCGPRQIGKTTMLQELCKTSNRSYVTLDDIQARELAKQNPELFFEHYRYPILIDEVQYAPELFSYIKLLADQNKVPGEFWLTGSQQFAMIKNVTESMAGRVCLLNMFGLSFSEINGYNTDFPFLPKLDDLKYTEEKRKRVLTKEVFEIIFKGSMPVFYNDLFKNRELFFENYIATYLMRDAYELGGINNPISFRKFLVSCAARIGNQVNYASLSEDAGISQPTAKSWLYLLQSLGIVFLLQPYNNNILKSMVKTPKLYFYDTGLAAYLAKWPSAEILESGNMNGAFFETFVVSEIKKNLCNTVSSQIELYYYRDSHKNEIDLIIEHYQTLHPIEIKKNASPSNKDILKFKYLDKLSNIQVGTGGIICSTNKLFPIDKNNYFIPFWLI